MAYKLVVDSCCELIPVLKESLNAKTVPLKMTVDGIEYIDDEHLDVKNFIEKMNAYKGQAKSSCPSPGEYAEKFAGDDTVFVVTLSSQLSGSYSSAMIAKDIVAEKGVEVHVFDSRSASAGELLIALKIKEFIDLCLDKNQIVKNVVDFISTMKTFFVLENLDNLVKNGRMNKIVGHIASVLNIRAVLGADVDGNIAFFSKARGTKQAIEKLSDTIGTHCTETLGKTLVITHCNNVENANILRQILEKKYKFKDILIVATNGLSSMYANIGGLIVAF